jgi:hypothetical protein
MSKKAKLYRFIFTDPRFKRKTLSNREALKIIAEFWEIMEHG